MHKFYDKLSREQIFNSSDEYIYENKSLYIDSIEMFENNMSTNNFIMLPIDIECLFIEISKKELREFMKKYSMVFPESLKILQICYNLTMMQLPANLEVFITRFKTFSYEKLPKNLKTLILENCTINETLIEEKLMNYLNLPDFFKCPIELSPKIKISFTEAKKHKKKYNIRIKFNGKLEYRNYFSNIKKIYIDKQLIYNKNKEIKSEEPINLYTLPFLSLFTLECECKRQKKDVIPWMCNSCYEQIYENAIYENAMCGKI